MRVHPNNPSSNVLGGGITADQLSNAIAHSGYPLQSQVVDSVLAALQAEDLTAHVQEEWSYIDSDENQVRNLDALISAELHKRTPANSEEPKEPSEYLRFTLDLLIECKQSELPFVFFVRPTGSNRPTLGGMPHRTISVRTGHDDAEFLVEMSIDDALGTYDLPLSNPELTAIAMTRAHRRGKDLELSGDEAFRGLSLPLLKAESHYLAMAEPDPRRLYFDVRTIVPIAVLRAPIVAVRMDSGEPSLEAVPWVRMLRAEPGEALGWAHGGEVRGFDVVHVDYLATYIAQAVETAKQIAERATAFSQQALTGMAVWDLPTEDGDTSADPSSPSISHVDRKSAKDDPEPPPYLMLGRHFSSTQFAQWINRRSTEVHGSYIATPTDSTGGDS